MKIFGVSVSLIIVALVAYWIGAKFPGPANKLTKAL